MSLIDLMIQEYTSGVYQPGTPPPETKIRLIKPSLEISDSLPLLQLLPTDPPLHQGGLNPTPLHAAIGEIMRTA